IYGGCKNNVISYNTITDPNIGSIWIRGTSTTVTDSNEITNNIMHNRGLRLEYASNTVVANNVIVARADVAVRSTYGSNQRFYHNTIYGAESANAVEVSYVNAADYANEWKNNIIVGRANNYIIENLSFTGINSTWDNN